MHSNLRLYFVLLGIVILITCSAAVALTQQQQRQPGPAPSEVNPPQTPSETPSTGEQEYIRQNPNDSNTLPIRAETYAERHVISWGSLTFGFILGGAIGYLVGRQSGKAETQTRRNRAA